MSAGVSHELMSHTQTWPIFTPARYQNSHHQKIMTNHDWLVVLTILKNMSQWEGLPSGKLSHNYGKSPFFMVKLPEGIQNMFEPTR